jgi:hypothetical protein
VVAWADPDAIAIAPIIPAVSNPPDKRRSNREIRAFWIFIATVFVLSFRYSSHSSDRTLRQPYEGNKQVLRCLIFTEAS